MNKHKSRDTTYNQRFTFLQLNINNRKCCNTRSKQNFKKKKKEVSNAVQWKCENLCMGKSVEKKRVNERARKTDF